MDFASGGNATSNISFSDDGHYVVQVCGRDVIAHSIGGVPSSWESQIARIKEQQSLAVRFHAFTRAQAPSSKLQDEEASEHRFLCASDTHVWVWQLDPLRLYANIDNIEAGSLHVDFGVDENEVLVFHPWHTKLTIHGLDTGRSQVIKTPKYSHSNGYGYRPRTGQLAIILKPEASDVLTVHEHRTYELINRANLPTVDAQGLKWSPDGKWIAVWDTASAGTKVLIYTADGQFYRTYNGPPKHDDALDLGVKCVEWGPIDAQTGISEFLAVGKVNGDVDLLQCKTFSCSLSLSHVYQTDQLSPNVWRGVCTVTGSELEYTELSGSSALSAIGEPSGPPRGVSIVTFSADGHLLATVDLLRPHVLWIWSLGTTSLVTALIHESAVRQAVWHPERAELLITTANSPVPAVHHWSPRSNPVIVAIPVTRSEGGKYDIRWVASGSSEVSLFWTGSPEEYVLGHLVQTGGITQLEGIHTVRANTNARVSLGSTGQ